MTHRFSSFRFSAMLFENESRALGDVNISDFYFVFKSRMFLYEGSGRSMQFQLAVGLGADGYPVCEVFVNAWCHE